MILLPVAAFVLLLVVCAVTSAKSSTGFRAPREFVPDQVPNSRSPAAVVLEMPRSRTRRIVLLLILIPIAFVLSPLILFVAVCALLVGK